MQKLKDNIENLIKKSIISRFDSIYMHLNYSYLIDKDKTNSIEEIVNNTTVVSDYKNLITFGEIWFFNKSFIKISEINKKENNFNNLVTNYVVDNCSFSCKELDNLKNYVNIMLKADIIIDNLLRFLELKDNLNVEDCYIQTSFFKIPLFEKH